MNPIERLRDDLARRFPGLAMQIDPPAVEAASWFLDVRPEGGSPVAVEWRPDRGFGVSTPEGDDYGTGPDEVHPDAKAALDRVDALLRTGGRTGTGPMRLAELRRARGLSQAELAERAGVKQANVSRIEGRDDVLVKTLGRLAAAMGGSLSIRVRFPDGRDCELKV